MFNTMNTVRPNPYPQRGTGNYNAANGGTDKDGHNENAQDQQNQRHKQIIARGRVQDVQSDVVQRQAINRPANSAYPTPSYPQRQTYQVQTPPPIRYNPHQVNPMQYQAIQGGYQPINKQPNIQQPQQATNIQQQSNRSNKVNIAQIIKDFRNTIKAIATPPEIEEQVNHYLQIVEQQVREKTPQVNLIQSNLKIAASMLDKYISETLNKESKVVQNWLDALFLQRINYSYNEAEINPNFLVKFPDNNKTEAKENTQEEQQEEKAVVQEEHNTTTQNTSVPAISNQEESSIIEIEPEELTLDEEFTKAKETISKKPNITIIPQDTKLKSLFVEAKKQAFSNNPQKAMQIFKEAFNRATELNDNETRSRICLEVGKIYDDNDHFVQALHSYNKSLEYTTDVNVKSRAHYSMAQIYDDVNEVEPALNHYITSISYAGKSDDIIGQSDSLTRMGNIFTDEYNENAFDYYDVAKKLIEQTTDHNMKGYVLSNTADACVQFKKKEKALKYYAEAVKNYTLSNSKEEIAENYKAAAELMINFNSPNKAKSLLKKALVNAVKTKNEDLVAEINMLLISIE